MHDFKFKNRELYCEKVRVAAVAEKVGTPFYLYSHHTLVDHFTKLQRAFAPVAPLICFAMKSNSSLAVIKTLANEGAGFDVVSVGELKKALLIKADPQKITFTSVGKTPEEITFAIEAGILLFNIESRPELETIQLIARRLKKRVKVAIRVNPDVEAATHDFITTGTLQKKFGIDLRSTHEILKEQKKYPSVEIKGLHMHIGSQIVSNVPFIKAVQKMTDFIAQIRSEGIEIEYLDIGGGLGIIYKDENPQTAEAFAQAVLPFLKKTGLKIIMEPGRFIAGNAGIFVTRLLYLKDNGYKTFYIVDGGMNDLIRPSLYNAYHDIVAVQSSRGKTLKVDVVGPICESGDFLGKDRTLPVLKSGALLAVMGAGAYGHVMSSNYNIRCRVPEVMVKGQQWAVSRPRETFADLVRGETVPAFLSV